jgi:hypothetical protein
MASALNANDAPSFENASLSESIGALDYQR